MKIKTLLLLFLFFGIVIFNAHYAMALEIPNPVGPQNQTIPDLIDKIATWLLEIGATIAVIIVIWAAFLFMTSGGSAEKVTTARKTLLYAIVGLTILLLAKGVTLFVQNVLSGKF